MKITIEIADEELDDLATMIAEKVGTTTREDEPEPDAVEDDDDLAGDAPAAKKTKGPTLEEVQDAITKAAKLNKPAVKALLAKCGVERGSELAAEKYPKFLEALAKIKKA